MNVSAKRRVLLVDDDVAASTAAAGLLETLGGFEVEIENDSEQALALADHFEPDLFLLDVDMPRLDGGQLAAQLRAKPQFKETPIIFRSSLVTASDEGNRAGFHYLAKPCRPEALLECVENVLASCASAR